ncbi:MAG: C4-type zinc ribbon domain-containing protein [Syntrophobacterales bacterium]|nr:C4-type zinc ribbon domain-containing protein [Syntrophobacterales bacterium]
MEQQLKTIYEAQKICTQIISNEKKILSVPKKIHEMDETLKELADRVARGNSVVEELEKDRRKKEKEIDTEKDKVKKFESKLYEVKTNKEYQALLKEIEEAKEGNDKTEEEVLVLMERIEELKKDVEAAKKELKEKEAETATERKKLNDELQSVDAVVADLKKTRDTLLAAIDENLRTTFLTLMERRDGLAVVNVKNEVCLGCFMNIPPQLFIEVTKNRQMILCPSCNRIFYFIDEE